MILLTFLLACGSPTHLQYDHGRAYYEALNAQSNLNRSTAVNEVYPLDGTEAAAVRAQSEEATSKSDDQIETLESNK